MSRIQETLYGIARNREIDNGPHYSRRIAEALKSFSSADIAKIDSALSMGPREDGWNRKLPQFMQMKSQNTDVTQKRIAVRACILAEIVMKGRPAGFTHAKFETFHRLSERELYLHFKMCFPVVTDRGVKSPWGSGFTDPRNHHNANFRYIVHALRINEPHNQATNKVFTPAINILLNPNHTLRSWAAISCSVIDQNHSRTYRPSGLILDVPPENILTVYEGDQGFKNQTGTVRPPYVITTEQVRDAQALLLNEIVDKDDQYRGQMSPDDLLSRTGTSDPYNEVVVAGTSHTAPTVISVIGIFYQVMQTDLQTRSLLLRAANRLSVPLVMIDN